MRCEAVVEFLDGTRSPSGIEQRQALDHLAACEECSNAWTAIEALEEDRDSLIPVPSDGALPRAVLRAAQLGDVRRAASRRVFWRGVGVGLGGALAAGVLAAVLMFQSGPSLPPAVAAPEVTLALNQSRDVNVTLDSPTALRDAEIHVVLSGAVALQGFDHQRELRWRTDLDRGLNQLTLPLVALGGGGGQVLVEVLHSDKRRSFVIDVHTNSSAGDVG